VKENHAYCDFPSPAKFFIRDNKLFLLKKNHKTGGLITYGNAGAELFAVRFDWRNHVTADQGLEDKVGRVGCARLAYASARRKRRLR
jgi:hypothetical protein